MKKTILIIVALFLALQFIPTAQENPQSDPVLALKPPEDVDVVMKKACYNCHTNNTQWPTYSKIAPISFMITSNVKKARQAINFSEYESIANEIKIKRLQRGMQLVKSSLMSPSSYKLMHGEAELNSEEKQLIINYFESLIQKLENGEKNV